MTSVLYQIGAVTMSCPMGLNPQEADEEFGHDFAVKPVVGAQQPRESVGPADTRLTLAGTIYPFRFAAAGGGTGQDEIEMLKGYAAAGEPLLVTRGGRNLGYYLVEKGGVRHRNLARQGIGRQQQFSVALVQSPSGPSAQSLVSLFTGLVGLLGTAVGGTR